MASNINTTTINTTYPIAGQDNNSQGFRDNFTNINSNFVETKAEIEDIQSKGIFTSALTGSTVTNDMNGTILRSANLVDSRETVVTHPNSNDVGSTINLSIVAGSYHTVSTATLKSITLAFSNGTVADWPASGEYSRIRVEIEVALATDTITLPSVVTGSVLGLDLSTNKITVNAPGTYIYEFSTRTGGSSVNIAAVNVFTPSLRTVDSSVGDPGDLAGMSGFDELYIYTCIADFDGTTSIWRRTIITDAFWS
jgi:hypothetical protein